MLQLVSKIRVKMSILLAIFVTVVTGLLWGLNEIMKQYNLYNNDEINLCYNHNFFSCLYCFIDLKFCPHNDLTCQHA